MAKTDRELVVDIGSTGVRCADFEYPAAGGFVLNKFTHAEYTEQLTESNRTAIISAALRETLETIKPSTNRVAVCVSGQAAFMRFVKLPPVTEEESRVKQIVEYEARQNVPFPMDEVIWDYQLIGGDDEDLEVMFVVIKNDIVESVIDAITNVSLRPTLVDFAPAALYNVARANHVGDNECVMILNIGGRCTNLLFLDGDRYFARTIPIAGFSITQQIAKEFGITAEEAEVLKRRHGFVALGGAYEEPESEVAATISKIIRNVMTRLHGELNRSISVYRTQQKGNKPVHLYLAGGSSTMAFTDNFFSEKLRLDVSYLNPFKIVSLNNDIDVTELQEAAHIFPEVVGVGLRHIVECPVEVSLIPESLRKQQELSKKKPFLVGGCIAWLLILLIFVIVDMKKTVLFETTADEYQVDVDDLTKKKNDIKYYQTERSRNVNKFESVKRILDQRYIWSELYNELQLAKPEDVWLVHVQTADGPLQEKRGMEEAPDNRRLGPGHLRGPGQPRGRGRGRQRLAADFDRHIFSAGLPHRRDTPETDSEDDLADKIGWLDIYGHSVTIPILRGQKRDIFDPKQLDYFETVTAMASDNEDGEPAVAAAEGGAPPEGEAADSVAESDAGAEAPAAGVAEPEDLTNIVTDKKQLPEIFLKRLQDCHKFSSSSDDSRIVFYRLWHQEFINLSTFRIQLKLSTPIDIARD